MSLVMIRGSVPFFWSQAGMRYRPPPKLDRSEILEGLSEVPVENRVEKRIERGVRVAQPDEQFDGVEGQTVTRGANDVQSEERQPADEKAEHQNAQRTSETHFAGDLVITKDEEDARVEKDHHQQRKVEGEKRTAQDEGKIGVQLALTRRTLVFARQVKETVALDDQHRKETDEHGDQPDNGDTDARPTEENDGENGRPAGSLWRCNDRRR